MDHAPHTSQSSAASAPAGMVPLPGGMRAHDLGALVAGRSAPLPYVLRNVAENLLHAGDRQGAEAVAAWMPGDAPLQCGLTVSRVLLPDSSGIPVLMDLAALREAVAEAGGDPAQVEPSIPVDLVVDHSLIVDRYGRDDAIDFNAFREFQRNGERYSFLKWAQQAFRSLRIVPPGMGIVHQVHLEYLAQITREPAADADGVLTSEFVLGCDSHTPMVNALGVLGWGVGGVDAEAALIGEPYKIRIPRVVGVRLTGALSGAATTTDLVLHVTQRLRETGVVGDFLEFIGPGLDGIGVPDRATLANMAPEYGATCAFFPVDRQTLAYLEATGRSQDHVARVEAHARATGLWRNGDAAEPVYSACVEIELGRIEPSIAGPKRPQDRIALDRSAESFAAALARPASEGGFGVADREARRRVDLESGAVEIGHGALAIAAITACTNTSNPGVMCAAGLLARNAVARGLKAAPWVKTSLAPGSRVVTRMLDQAGLSAPLEALGFFTVGYGCTTCSGKSGPIPEALSDVADDLVLCAALSGNRNFEGRVHGDVRGAYLCSPPLVVAFALAGTMAVDFASEPLGSDPGGKPVYLRDIWPDAAEIRETLQSAVSPEDYRENYAGIFEGTALWQKLQANRSPLFGWDRASTYLKRPPFLDADFLARRADWPDEIAEGRALAVFGDSLTTDHVTPSGAIAPDTLAGRYLMDCGEKETALNAYTQRRGNHDVMARATFANPRIANLLAGERRGGWSRTAPAAPLRPVFDVAEEYRRDGIATIVLAGRDFGMGSSRDWAAKGPALLGVKAVIAKNFERIHRANLVALGIAPFRFAPGEGVAELGLDGFERFTIRNLHAVLESGAPAEVEARASDGSRRLFRAELDTHDARERALLRDGGVFARMLARFDGAGSEQKSGRTNP